MMMLRHMNLDSFADRIHKAALQTIPTAPEACT